MNSNDKFAPDDIDETDGTLTRKIRTLEELGVLDDLTAGQGSHGATTVIETFPYVKTNEGRVARLVNWLKKN